MQGLFDAPEGIVKIVNSLVQSPIKNAPEQRIKDLKMHLSLPWKEEAKSSARIELASLLSQYGEPMPEFAPKQLTLF
jgi:hypothetical protein